MRRASLALAVLALLLLTGCTVKYIKFPAEEYLTGYWKDRLQLQDDTFLARRKCAVVKAVILAPGTGVPVPTPAPANLDRLRDMCTLLDARLAALEIRDLKTIQAGLRGDTVDKDTLENLRSIVGPLLGLAKDIVL